MPDNSTNASENASAAENDKSFLETAQEAIGDAIDATITAAKENPVAAAAIAAGAAAAVGGAAYAASQLLGDKDQGGNKKK